VETDLSNQAIVYTAKYEESYGYEFEINEQYLVYAYQNEAGQLKTGLCERNAK
jgi:hypothetical protein